MTAAPTFHIDLDKFKQNPYPIFAAMRERAPIARVPELNGIVFTRFDDISIAEKNIDVFSSVQPGGLMDRLMGQNMMRKDGRAHLNERKVMLRATSTASIRDHWTSVFQNFADQTLDEIYATGGVDFVRHFAMPFSGRCLGAITGLSDSSYMDIDRWSQAMIDGIANYAGDRETEYRCRQSTDEIDNAIERALRRPARAEDLSLISIMKRAGMNEQNIQANIKLNISGGQNEPRDVIAGAVWALLTHREQFQSVEIGEINWSRVFDEYVRWISPIGMSPRRIAQDATFNGIELARDTRIFFMFSAANRDPDVFEHPDVFDLTRDASKHLGFGAGPHYCAGAALSKAMICDAALPRVFARLQNLRLAPAAEPKFTGWAFRGLASLPLRWDCVSNRSGC